MQAQKKRHLSENFQVKVSDNDTVVLRVQEEDRMPWQLCHGCMEQWMNLRESGLCVNCEPWAWEIFRGRTKTV